ncbi:BRO-N domain-containing protein [Pseudomonas helleri]|uniref:BRO-N domain-containing protein n=1 Tax=Pseudomonas helleri TaxID=1608996 RepID=UPI003FCF75BD
MTNNSTNIIPFNFGKQQVRTLLIDEQPWFVAADVCSSLAIANVSLAVNGRADRDTDGLDEDEKGIATVNTPSGAQEMLVVNESGLYALIFKSRKAEAKRFKKWVTAEVLPAIRKHGRYEDHGKMATLMDELIGMSELNVIKGLIRDKSKAVPTDQRQGFQLVMHSRLHTRFNVPRTELIPAGQFEQACNFIASYAIEGEFLPKARTSSASNTLSDQELYDVFFLMHHFLRLKRIYDNYQIGAALRMLRSEAGAEMIDHFRDSMIAISVLKKRLPDMEAAAVRMGHQHGTVMGGAA